ncbi:hypothetical protein FNV43_RR24230 [Rhamnella rubrinervis]|uniref:UMP-CMP kinase n=1 Tax=Rhamnella rubrinervis TaxID=2594499 RepID=A0A8K0DS08_9ROSA|nr:hypothetical protein FNV43_RR24230 [Rhamnella rubrinervis]
MWRRVASLSPLISSSKPSILNNQRACIFKFLETFKTEIATQAKPFITFVLGGPGSGKGTQCAKIVETFGLTHLSAGDLLRREITSNSAYGSLILNTIKEGKIVPSEVTIKLIQREMESCNSSKFLIDGFPRSEENRIAFEQIIGAEPNVVLFFDCPEEEMVKRVLNRNQGRVDDNIDTIKKRLKVFEALNRPVINYYSQKGKLYKINAVGTEDEIFEQVHPIFAACELMNVMSSRPSQCGNMVITLPALSFYATNVAIHCSSKSNKSRKQKQMHQNKSKSKTNTTSVRPYAKPSPTPLLIRQKPTFQTKLQALEAVIKDLEKSIENGIDVDTDIFSSLLETCYRLEAIHCGMRIHRLIPANLLRRNVGLSSKLLRLYASCGYVDKAHEVFDQMSNRNASAFAWNSLISGYAELGLYEDALALYFQMEEEGVEPDRFTFPRVLKACGGVGVIHIGEAVHRNIVRLGYYDDGFVLNALVDMYAKCGDIVKARKVFHQISSRDSVSWNSMLTGYIRHGLSVEALDIFCQMLQQGYRPDSVALSTILSDVSSLKLGVQIHGWAIRHGIEWNLSIANSLVDMYSSHGKVVRARWLFKEMPERDIVSWNSIISAHRKDPEALVYFDEMEKAGAIPDNITFVSLLSACAHLGLVKDGERLYSIMRNGYGIRPIMEHYGCMVNLYGRAGLFKEAYDLIVEGMDFEAGPTVWGALLYACYLHGNVEVGEVAADRLFELEPDNEHNFKLLMKIYGNAGRLEDAERVRTMMADRGLDS